MHNIIIAYINSELTMGMEVSENDDLLEGGILDSMGMLKLVRFIEMKFQIQIPFEDLTLENFKTVKKISDYVSIKSCFIER